MGRLIRALGLALVLGGAVAGIVLGQSAQPRVAVLPTSGVVDQIMAGYLHDGITTAQSQGYSAVVIELNTPGGDLNAMRDIVTTLLNAPLPTIAWVGPDGARAASAGTFITLATNVAVMSPGTNIGAATPIDSSGQDIGGALGEKVLQDTEALLRNISTARGRNYDWALTTVTDAKAYTAQEALDAGGIDGLAGSINDAVGLANGRTVTIAGGQPVTLELSGAQIDTLAMNPLQSFLHLLTDPNIAFILFTIGFYGLIFELSNPNFLTGSAGAIAIVLAFIGFGSLPLNVGGLLLIGLAVLLFVFDLHVTSHGVLTVAGIICFVLGAGALYTQPGIPGAPEVQVALPVLVTMTILTGSFMALVTLVAIRSRRNRTAPGLIGAGLAADALGEVRRPLAPLGSVYAGGEEWTARSADERTLDRGTPVRVIRQEGLTLVVEPADGAGPAA